MAINIFFREKIDGAYTIMIRNALNKRWQDHTSNIDLYGNILKITIQLENIMMCFSGHFWRSREELIREVLMWETSTGVTKTWTASEKVCLLHNLETTSDALQMNGIRR